ncbi:histidine kinase [Massilia sp. Dwa41.01b]|uniref:sensor histidine kinase n=1 Tax=unclassified Massilia TaxID=2609279 RepID=UPI001603275A|nr:MULTISPECIES: histidine kinase [unclassified Massilia]QNA88017.1 histidine kinase [Massilia sp. Dwa41.01b]QNA98919.1 histidine kinase [Massilia sp. Se16.2.3]
MDSPSTIPFRGAELSTSSSRDYWLFQLSGWGGLALVAILSTLNNFGEAALRFVLAKLMCIVSGLLVSHCWRLFLRRRGWIDRHGPPPLKGILSGLLVLSVVQTGVLALSDLVFRHGALLADPEAPSLLFLLCLLWYALFAVWTLCYSTMLARRRALRFELEKLQLEVSVKDAELRALQAQVNPHFFFNSLNSIRALIFHDPELAARAVGQLGGMMRHSLRAGQTATVPLADELAAVEAYLGMEKHRFDERLRITMDIEPGLEAVAIPPMALQTLVENAVKHGVEPSIGPCELRIGAHRKDDGVELTVANEGRLAQASDSTRLGLANTARRLSLLFGPRAGCTLAERDGWVIAHVVLPLEST